jgi:hypothetical protein
MSKFKINDKVQTNREYMAGFQHARVYGINKGKGVSAPPGLRWLKNLTIIKVGQIYPTKEIAEEEANNKFASNYVYTCQSKSGKIHYINECFLEKIK